MRQIKNIRFLEDFYDIQEEFDNRDISTRGLQFIKFIKQPIDNINLVNSREFPIALAKTYK